MPHLHIFGNNVYVCTVISLCFVQSVAFLLARLSDRSAARTRPHRAFLLSRSLRRQSRELVALARSVRPPGESLVDCDGLGGGRRGQRCQIVARPASPLAQRLAPASALAQPPPTPLALAAARAPARTRTRRPLRPGVGLVVESERRRAPRPLRRHPRRRARTSQSRVPKVLTGLKDYISPFCYTTFFLIGYSIFSSN